MRNLIKKFFSVFLSVFLLSAFASAQSDSDEVFAESGSELLQYDVKEFVLENGLSVYILEDFSSALVRVEFSAKAGFSSQSPENAGFFPLYTRLFKYASPD
uniref:hypothetical protein n=1 Tax=Treponema sp. TaxID=166 RepID=UPI00298E2414